MSIQNYQFRTKSLGTLTYPGGLGDWISSQGAVVLMFEKCQFLIPGTSVEKSSWSCVRDQVTVNILNSVAAVKVRKHATKKMFNDQRF